MEVVLLWFRDGVEVMERNDLIFFPRLVNHNLMISNPTVGDSGNYTCRAAVDDEVVEQSIAVNVIAGNI